MAELAKAHPASITTGVEMVGPDLTFVTITYPATMAAETNGSGTALAGLAAVQQVVAKRNSIVAVGPLFTTGTQQTFALENGVADPVQFDIDLTADIVALAANYGTQTLVGTTVAVRALEIA